MNNIAIRHAKEKDIDTIFLCIKGLAEHVNELDHFTATKEELRYKLFHAGRSEKIIIAQNSENKAIGFALYFEILSTFTAKPYLFIEDLFVFPQFRNNGTGGKLFQFILDEAKKTFAPKVEWNVNSENKRAIDFYKKLGAKHLVYKNLFTIKIR